jgi:protein-tyrosine-phosphatase
MLRTAHRQRGRFKESRLSVKDVGENCAVESKSYPSRTVGSNPASSASSEQNRERGRSRVCVELLQKLNLPTEGLRSKSWEEFAQPGAPALDFIFTVCDQAAGEICPVWPGEPITAHWGFPDPAAAVGSDTQKRAAFANVFRQIDARIKIFCAIPTKRLSRVKLTSYLQLSFARRGVPVESFNLCSPAEAAAPLQKGKAELHGCCGNGPPLTLVV